jgi:hypothetical protein
MVMDELQIDETQATALIQKYGSVRTAIEHYQGQS